MLLSLRTIAYEVIGPPLVSGSFHEIVTRSRVHVVTGASGLDGLDAASTDNTSVNSPYP